MNKQPSGRPQFIMRFIRRFVKENGYSPTLREIATAIEDAGLGAPESGKMSISMVSANLEYLEGLGVLRRNRGIARGIVLTKQADGR